MNDQQLLRYSRQIMLPQIDVEGQSRLLGSSALIVGLGGLGSPAAMYLAAAGVGRLLLADFDQVELSNLQRQIIYGSSDLGRAKTEAAAERLRELNPDVKLDILAGRLDCERLLPRLTGVDVVLDGSDNFDTRFAVNAACMQAGVPLVSGAVIRSEGQLAVFRLDQPGSPCYRCLFPEAEEARESCSETGVLAPLPGIIGSLQALEAMKILLGLSGGLSNRLMLFDALGTQWRSLALSRDPACPVCGESCRDGAPGS
jgi:molybdopterin/thiamine biosynthesis adenylyltransferase